MIEITELTKRYRDTLAVDRLTFSVKPGRVTGFLGPNGAGKSTTMRSVLGLDRPDSGQALVNGSRYAGLAHPLREVGALLDAGAVHPGRTARAHLRCLARTDRIGNARVEEVLGAVGLAEVADRRVKGFSLGMRQRLGIAAALLGDPGVLLFDEPVNGLDPEGIRWIRDLMRSLAAEGRTVLVSSHLMSEMALTADHVVLVGRGRLITETSMAELSSRFRQDFLVRTPAAAAFAEVLRAAGGTVSDQDDGLSVRDLSGEEIGELAAAHRIVLSGLAERSASLEDAYLQLTQDAVQYRSSEGIRS